MMATILNIILITSFVSCSVFEVAKNTKIEKISEKTKEKRTVERLTVAAKQITVGLKKTTKRVLERMDRRVKPVIESVKETEKGCCKTAKVPIVEPERKLKTKENSKQITDRLIATETTFKEDSAVTENNSEFEKISEETNYFAQLVRDRYGIVDKCLGLILSDRYILTAAQCFDRSRKPDSWSIVYGLSNLNDQKVTIDNRIHTIIIHGDYENDLRLRANQKSGINTQAPLISNNIALVKTVDSIIFTEKISPIKLYKYEVEIGIQGKMIGVNLSHAKNIRIGYFNLDVCDFHLPGYYCSQGSDVPERIEIGSPVIVDGKLIGFLSVPQKTLGQPMTITSIPYHYYWLHRQLLPDKIQLPTIDSFTTKAMKKPPNKDQFFLGVESWNKDIELNVNINK